MCVCDIWSGIVISCKLNEANLFDCCVTDGVDIRASDVYRCKDRNKISLEKLHNSAAVGLRVVPLFKYLLLIYGSNLDFL